MSDYSDYEEHSTDSEWSDDDDFDSSTDSEWSDDDDLEHTTDSEWSDDDDFDPSRKRRKTYPYQLINPTIVNTAPSLKDATSAAVAISLWKHVDIMTTLTQVGDYCVRDSCSWDSLIQKVKELSSKLPIPTAVKSQIHQYISIVQKEITIWATYHFRSVFLNTAKDFVVYNFVEDFIWHSNGTIKYRETAKNISKSKSPIISEIEKYNFLCTYCLENEMQQMASVLSNFSRFQLVDFEQHPLIRYWNCYFSKKLDLMPKDEDLTLDCTMFRHYYVDNWSAKEYFFDRFSSDDQVVNAIWLIDELDIVYQKMLLMKLNESQRISVYLERSVQIIMNYVETGVNSVDVITTWSEVRNLITREQFMDLFAQLLKERAPGSILTEVWNSSDYDFKNHFLSDYKCIKKILYSFHWTNDFNFVMIVFQELNVNMKRHVTKQFFTHDFCEKLFSQRENLQWLDRLSNIYHDHARKKKSKQFKQRFVFDSISIKQLCLKYYSSGDVRGLNDMLTYIFSQMPDRIPEYKRKLLMSFESMSICAELLSSNIENLSKIIVDALPTTDLQTEFRKKLVFSQLGIDELKDLLFKKDLSKVKVIIDSFLTSDEDKKELKEELIINNSPLMCYASGHSDEFYLQSLLLLVFEDGNVKKFKKYLSVDGIFNAMLVGIVVMETQYGLNPTSFDRLNRFLNWYFESPSEVTKYKLQRINSHWGIGVLTKVSALGKKKQCDVENLKVLMNWFFDNDTAEIQIFMNYHRKYKFAKKF